MYWKTFLSSSEWIWLMSIFTVSSPFGRIPSLGLVFVCAAAVGADAPVVAAVSACLPQPARSEAPTSTATTAIDTFTCCSPSSRCLGHAARARPGRHASPSSPRSSELLADVDARFTRRRGLHTIVRVVLRHYRRSRGGALVVDCVARPIHDADP